MYTVYKHNQSIFVHSHFCTAPNQNQIRSAANHHSSPRETHRDSMATDSTSLAIWQYIFIRLSSCHHVIYDAQIKCFRNFFS